MPAINRLERVRAHRQRLRAQGMRLFQVWVPDTRSPALADELRRQSRLIADSPHEAADQAFVSSIGWGSIGEEE